MTDLRHDVRIDPPLKRVVVVTGPSGAGRSTAVRVLEDLGHEVIDNLPMSLLPRLIDGPPHDHPLAIVADVRNRDFSVEGFLDMARALSDDETVAFQLLFLDCSEDVLVQRYSETRRRHPLARDTTPLSGIREEIELLTAIRARADVLIDTSPLTPHDLRAEIETWFAPDDNKLLSVSVQSFSYKRGLPRGLDIVLDCRFLRNPHWEPALRALDGRDCPVADYIEADPLFAAFMKQVDDFATLLIPAYKAEGKAHLSIGFGCTGGQHRSVAVAERFAKTLAQAGWQVSKRHREIERRRVATSADKA
jgi:UPF0042 nucleotide-binding protein